MSNEGRVIWGVKTDAETGVFVALLYEDERARYEPLWTEAALAQLGQPRAPSACVDEECAVYGCWCRNVEAGETFHCCSCIDPFDIEYECAVYRRMCIGCCGHAACARAWESRHAARA